MNRSDETRELLRNVTNGDANATNELLDRYRKRLRRMVEIRMDDRLVSRLDASDVVQEALTAAADKLAEYAREQPIPLYPWLRQFAWNHLVDAHRYHMAQKRDIAKERNWQLSDHSLHDLDKVLVLSGGEPDQRILKSELATRLRVALAKLKKTTAKSLCCVIWKKCR